MTGTEMEKLDGKSLDIVEQNIERLKKLFPEVFSEGKINFDQLNELLGNYIVEDKDHYNFTWHGKREAGRLAQRTSTGTLRPCRSESVEWDSTANLFIEGDNLEVLKLLQKSYNRRVKMIYIDPPYNTGSDFVYEDDFKDGVQHYLEMTEQLDGNGKRFGTNSSTDGRVHTNWLNMMYPRLKLARNLLTDDGVIFISIDDNEQANLKKLCDQIFGEENFVATLTWETKQSARGVPPQNLLMGNHEYVLCYAKQSELVRFFGIPRQETDFDNPDGDPRGLWRSESMKATGNQNNFFTIVDPSNGNRFHANWAFSEKKIHEMIADNLIIFPKSSDGTPRQKKFIDSYKNENKAIVTSLRWHSTERSTQQIMKLFDQNKIFDFPKPLSLIEFLCQQILMNDDIVLDFFAGSCTTAHAVMQLNAEDGGNRKFICVQLPEPCDKKSEAFNAGYKNIADVGKERIRRAAKKIQEKNSDYQGDLGFKVFELDSSNIKRWEADFDTLEKDLIKAVDYIKHDRSSDDILYELLLKYGLDLTIPIETRTIADKTVSVIGSGALVVCLENDLSMELVDGIGALALKEELQPEIMRVVFKDDGFRDDVVKTNAIQTLKRYGIQDIKSL